jgi:hypothetical protein
VRSLLRVLDWPRVPAISLAAAYVESGLSHHIESPIPMKFHAGPTVDAVRVVVRVRIAYLQADTIICMPAARLG